MRSISRWRSHHHRSASKTRPAATPRRIFALSTSVELPRRGLNVDALIPVGVLHLQCPIRGAHLARKIVFITDAVHVVAAHAVRLGKADLPIAAHIGTYPLLGAFRDPGRG